jgi:pimeloyl-ACP methyl ester carboxylesterase
MSTYILVHGSWLGGWSWDAITERLQAAGHQVEAPTLAGHGTLSDHVDEVVALIDAHPGEEVILVGHSYAGMVIAGAASLRPETVTEAVFLDAYMPEKGQSAFDVVPAVRPLFEAGAAESGDGMVPPFDMAIFGLEPSIGDPIAARLRPWPIVTHTEKSPGMPSTVRGSFLLCAESPFFIELTDQLEARGWKTARPVVGHMAPLTDPDIIVNSLMELRS